LYFELPPEQRPVAQLIRAERRASIERAELLLALLGI